MSTASSSRRAVATPEPRSGGLWYPLLASPAAWAGQGLLGWYFGEKTCGDLTPPAVRWIVLGISVVALVVALVGMSRSWKSWHAVGRTGDPLAEHTDRVNFMAFGGFLVSTIFAIAIVWGGLSSAFLSDCGRMR